MGTFKTRERVKKEFMVNKTACDVIVCHNNKTHSWLQEFHTQQGEFLHTFEKPLPDAVTSEELEEKNQEISIDKVLKWAEETGNIKMRFAFFETFHANSELYLMVIKPL